MTKIINLKQQHVSEAILDTPYTQGGINKEWIYSVCNKAIEIALAEQSQEQYITAEEARKLGTGNAEWRHVGGTWAAVSSVHPWFEGCQYRAIKHLEPVEPHAELKAMYAQQVKDGTLGDFVWEFKNGMVEWLPVLDSFGMFYQSNEYRCTPKQAAQKLMKFDPVDGTPQPFPSEANQYRDWHGATAWLFNPYSGARRDARDVGTDVMGHLIFNDKHTPTLADPAATFEPTCQVKNLDTGELKTMTREAAKLLQAETMDVCDWFTTGGVLAGSPFINSKFEFKAEGIYTYKLKAKPLKQISWKDVPVGVMTNFGVIIDKHAHRDVCILTYNINHGTTWRSGAELELAPADQQDWIAVQDGQTGRGVTQVLQSKGFTTKLHSSYEKFIVTGIAKGYELK